MTDFILALGKMNLSMSVAIFAVCLLRRPVRKLFQAQISYLLWALIPIAGIGSLLPPRTAPPISFVPIQIPPGILSNGTDVTRQLPMTLSVEHLGAHLSQPTTALQTMMTAPHVAFDLPMTLFYVWVLGLMLMVALFARQQARFHAAARRGEAGPAIVGFWRPRLVIPLDFSLQYTAREQAAILAHEQAHLERQDFRVSGFVALMRCICWFNPLVHLGAKWLQTDQELACDAAALERKVSRTDYVRALLKTQMETTRLPVGCAWPSTGHPLTERIALLTLKRPSTTRRALGITSVALAGFLGGICAWAAEPPVPAAPPVQQSDDLHTHVEDLVRQVVESYENGTPQNVVMQLSKPVDGFKLPGKLKSISFAGISAGKDELYSMGDGVRVQYVAKFDNGDVLFNFDLTQNPMLIGLGIPPYGPIIHREDNGPSPGLETTLRHEIQTLQKGNPYRRFMDTE